MRYSYIPDFKLLIILLVLLIILVFLELLDIFGIKVDSLFTLKIF